MQQKLFSHVEYFKTNDEISILKAVKDDLRRLPKPDDQFMPGVFWGCYSQLYTPAYWKAQYLLHNVENQFVLDYKMGNDILEEVVACLLGGFGLKAEMGLAAFNRMRERRLIRFGTHQSAILSCLQEKFEINGKFMHYRFPNQKAKFISEFLNRTDLNNIPLTDDIELRNWLLTINGIGPKTASWITRNFLDSENVAIIDVHIFRACLKMGLYSQNFDIQKDYLILEQIFLNFCLKLDVQPSKMDALIWLQMKDASRYGIT